MMRSFVSNVAPVSACGKGFLTLRWDSAAAPLLPAACVLTAPALGQHRRGGPAHDRAGGSTQSGVAASTVQIRQLGVVPTSSQRRRPGAGDAPPGVERRARRRFARPIFGRRSQFCPMKVKSPVLTSRIPDWDELNLVPMYLPLLPFNIQLCASSIL